MVLVDPVRPNIDPAQLNRFAYRAQRLTGVLGKVDILITSKRRLQELNRRFRKKNKPTDVLSFPRPHQAKNHAEAGGDIAISVEIATDNAARCGHAAFDELKILILHGMLHLAGFDHERDNGEMAARETALRKRFGLPTALIERSQKTPDAYAPKTQVRSRSRTKKKGLRKKTNPTNLKLNLRHSLRNDRVPDLCSG